MHFIRFKFFETGQPLIHTKSLFTLVFYLFLGEKVVLEDEDDEEKSVDFNEEEVLQRCHDFQKDYEKRKNQGQPDCFAEKSTLCSSPPVPKPRQFIGGRPISESAAKNQHSPRTTVSP